MLFVFILNSHFWVPIFRVCSSTLEMFCATAMHWMLHLATKYPDLRFQSSCRFIWQLIGRFSSHFIVCRPVLNLLTISSTVEFENIDCKLALFFLDLEYIKKDDFVLPMNHYPITSLSIIFSLAPNNLRRLEVLVLCVFPTVPTYTFKWPPSHPSRRL